MNPKLWLPGHVSRSRWMLAVLILAGSGLVAAVWSQPPPRGVPADLQPALPEVPEKAPRPKEGPGSVKEFVEVSKNDAIIAVTVGQSRIFTAKMDLFAPGKPAPVVDVADPAVIEVNTKLDVKTGRQLLVIGKRIGVTNLLLVTSDQQVFNFEVHVMADLDLLRRLIAAQDSFKGVNVKLSQMREHIVVDGDVTDSEQGDRLIETIEAYLNSVQLGQATEVKEKGAAAAEKPDVKSKVGKSQVISLIRMPVKGDFDKLEGHLKRLFPDATLELKQLHEIKGRKEDSRSAAPANNVGIGAGAQSQQSPGEEPTPITIVVKGMARDLAQIGEIITLIRATKANVINRIETPPGDDLKTLQNKLQSLYKRDFDEGKTKLQFTLIDALPGAKGKTIVVHGQAPSKERVGEIIDIIRATKYEVINLIQVPPPVGTAQPISSFATNLSTLQEQLNDRFPDARIQLSQTQEHDIIVKGQARDTFQVNRIIEMVSAYQDSYKLRTVKEIMATIEKGAPAVDGTTGSGTVINNQSGGNQFSILFQRIMDSLPKTRVINMIRVPGPRQVLLKVRIAELNRTALKQVGTDFLFKDDKTLLATRLSANSSGGSVTASGANVTGIASLLAGGPATMFGVFENAHFAVFLNALRQNQLLKILAEPNLVALDGHRANFLAGGEFPIPVPQAGTGGGATPITIEFKKFGVSLDFLPNILDGSMVRLQVDPEVSTIDYSIGTTINGTTVPGLNTRKSHTVVEIKEGQTLAIAGLMAVTLEGTTNRIPGLGDVPVIGPLFANTNGKRTEKELIVLVTPYLVEAMPCEQVPPYPGAEVNGPNDLEFYLANRIEGRTGRDWRSTTQRYTVLPNQLPTFLRLQDQYIRGPFGFSE